MRTNNADALLLLSELVEHGRAIAPSLAPDKRQQLINILVEAKILKKAESSHAPSVLCPSCGELNLKVDENYIAMCSNCGRIKIPAHALYRYKVNLDRLMHKLRLAIEVSASTTQPREILENKVWLLGDIDKPPRRILFARTMNAVGALDQLHGKMKSEVGVMRCIIITTTTDHPELHGFQVEWVKFGSSFRLHGSALNPDTSIWGAAKYLEPTFTSETGPFSSDFRSVRLSAAKEPIPLTIMQGKLFKILWELNGARISNRDLKMNHQINKPSDYFSKYKDATEAYKGLIKVERHDLKYFYSIPRT